MFLAVPVPEARVGAECQACGPGGSGWDRTAVSPGPPQRLPSRPRVLSAGLCERRAFRTRAVGQHRSAAEASFQTEWFSAVLPRGAGPSAPPRARLRDENRPASPGARPAHRPAQAALGQRRTSR